MAMIIHRHLYICGEYMIVTKIEKHNSRFKIYIDGSIAFLLYKGDLRRFGVEEDAELSEDSYNGIKNLLFERGKERALYMLDNSFKTEKYIKDKLKSGYYPEDVIDAVIEKLKEMNLVNDLNYAKLYIEYKASAKSTKKIVQDLYVKGIKREYIDQAFEESEFNEYESLDRIIQKKKDKYNLEDKKELNKFYNYLLSKGYSYNDVKSRLALLDITLS